LPADGPDGLSLSPGAYGMGVQREFLGWDGMPLERAATWLCDHFDKDMKDVLVAPPGGRAGRILVELLARRVGAGLRPPTVMTSGVLSDHLLEIGGTPAGRLVRTLAWKQALLGLDAESLERIVARPPAPADLAGWMRIAEEVRGLFGEVAAEGLDFGRVAENDLLGDVEGELKRWRALATAQKAMLALIESLDFVDPHIGRLRAIDAGKSRKVREVVLVGVVEMNALLRRALELCQAPVTALVFAPEDQAESFDPSGCLVPEKWSERTTSLDADRQWFVVDGPVDQADRVAGIIAGWDGKYSAEKISVGLADRAVAPYVRGTLASCGVVTRDAAGTPVAQTRPAMLLEAVGRFLKGERFADFAKLVRHPDVEAAIEQQDAREHGAEPGFEGLQPVNLVDDYHNVHLPWKADGTWLEKGASWDSPSLYSGMERLWSAVRGVFGDLQDTASRPITSIVPGLRQLLRRVYGGRELDPATEEDRVLIKALSKLGDALTDIESLPRDLAPEGSVASAIELTLRSVAGEEVPPPPARAGEPTIELLGWLELALDDAPALVVTGYEDGKVPESVRGDAYLPNRLRKSLGIVDNEKRLARDLYATELLLQSRDDVAFVSGRRSRAGDPQVPSRIVFHCEDAEVVPRVKQALHGGRRRVARVASDAGRVRELPRLDGHPEVEKISVTDFKTFLASPYQYYLYRVARLETLDDQARELDPLGFGSLAHTVLERFGRDERIRNEADPEKIKQFLAAELHEVGTAWYGKTPLPAVHLQLEQLEYRLGCFADKQAARRREGWEIREVEWKPDAGHLDFPVDGKTIRIRGRIDRIDYHPGKKLWAIWDYKTGEKVEKPVNAHRTTDGEWKDLQLPLYCLLAAELIGDDPPAEMGYIAIGRKPSEIGFMRLESWARRKSDEISIEEGIQEAIEVIEDVVRRIRQDEFFVADGFEPRDPIFAAIGGAGLIATGRGGEEVEE